MESHTVTGRGCSIQLRRIQQCFIYALFFLSTSSL